MDCERLTPPSGIPRSVYYARNKCICRKAEGRLTYYMLGIIGAALLPGREQQKYVIQESGCHLDAAHRACFSWTFSIYIKMLSTTNNVYLVSGIPGRGIVLFCWNEHTTYHVEQTCAVGYSNSSSNPQYPELRSVNRIAQWTSIPGHGRSTEFVTRHWLHVCTWLSASRP